MNKQTDDGNSVLLLYVALSRMVREHDSLTASRARSGDPPALTNEALTLAKQALHEFERTRVT